MQYYQLRRGAEPVLVAATETAAYDLTSVKPELDTFDTLVRTAEITDQSPDDIASSLLDDADQLAEDDLGENRTVPLAVDEVWAAGVTYEISEEARTEESSLPELYIDVYDAERPELFFKASGARTVGPGEPIGVRGDSEWNVPEPELGVVLYRGSPVGYTVGNDVSSRDIEGASPLYLPQAKIYDRCCSIGPCISTDVSDPYDLEMSMTITRDDAQVYSGEASTAELVRSVDELVSYFTRHNAVPELCVLLTGTSLVPDEGFSLRPGDRVSIEMEDVGTLVNPVVSV